MSVEPSSQLLESEPKEDHRIRVGREKRARMRSRLFESVMVVCSGGPTKSPAVIDDVVRHAKVARGTFYKYFDSLEQAIEQLALELADEMTADIGAVYEALEDPTLRTATGFQTFLLRAMMNNDWGRFFVHIGPLNEEDNLITAAIKKDLRLGLEAGVYTVPSVDIATDLLMGAKIEAIRRIIAGKATLDYIHRMTEMVLVSFGMTRDDARRAVRTAYDRLLAFWPGQLDWWRPIAGL